MDYIFFLSLRSRKTTPNWRRITQKNKLGVGVLARIIIRTLFDLGHRKSLYGPSTFCILIFRLKPRESTASNTFKLKTFWKCWVPTVLPSNIFCKKYLVGFHRYKPIFFFLHNGFYSNIMFKVTNIITDMAPRFEVPNSAVDMACLLRKPRNCAKITQNNAELKTSITRGVDYTFIPFGIVTYYDSVIFASCAKASIILL